jgi:hypothetical protein
VDAILKLIQRDIAWVEPVTSRRQSAPATAPDEADVEHPHARKESRRPTRSRRGNPAARQSENRQPEPQEATKQRPRHESRKPAPSPKDSGIDVNSPFGPDGPIPAFLLRSATKNN